MCKSTVFLSELASFQDVSKVQFLAKVSYPRNSRDVNYGQSVHRFCQDRNILKE